METNKGEFYVAMNGKDSNPGTLQKPFKTLDAAKEAVSDFLYRTPKLTKDIHVYIRGGTYISPYTFLLTPADSGKNGKKVIYSGYKNEQVYISSGIELKKWVKADAEFKGVSGVYKTMLPSDVNDIYCLYEDNKRSFPARHPNIVDGKAAYLRLSERTSAKSLQAKVDKKELPAGADYKYAQMVLWPGSHNDGEMQFNWYSSVDPIKKYNSTAGAFELYLPTWWDMTVGNRYYVQNVKKFIDTNGEFFYNKSTREIYYKPYGDIKKARIIAPARVNTICITGDPDDRVHDIVLTKLNICNSNFGESFSYSNDSLTYEGMIKIENARGITISNCRLFNSGYNAISMWGANEGNSVNNCLIENCGIGGIFIGMEYDQLPVSMKRAGEGQISKNNIVNNNIIRNMGQCSPGHGYGVFIRQSGYNKVTRNTFYNIPKGAINLYNKQTGYLKGTVVGGTLVTDANQEEYKFCRGNEISFNNIFDVMNDGSDCGAIITYGTGLGNIIDNNFIHDNPGIKEGPNVGIYLDDNSDGTIVKNNVVARIGGSDWVNGAMLKGRGIILENNIFYNTRSNNGVISTMITRVATWGMPQEQTHDFVCKNNIVYEDKPLTYLYYHWGNNYQFKTIKEQDRNVYYFINNPIDNPESPIIGYAIYEDGKADRWESVTFKKHKQESGIKLDDNAFWGDPLLSDPENNDFSLKEGSQALKLGFIQIQLDNVGINEAIFGFKTATLQMKAAAGVKNRK